MNEFNPAPGRAWTRTLAGAAVLTALAGCSAIAVTPLATGQVTVQAFELRGQDPSVLRQEAARLCGGRGEVLRESARGSHLPTPDSRIGRWLLRGVDAVMPSDRQAQLVVMCQREPGRENLSMPAPAMPDPEPAVRGVKGRRAAAVDRDVPYGF